MNEDQLRKYNELCQAMRGLAIQLFDSQSGKKIRAFRTGQYSEGVPALQFMPDGERLVIATNRRGGIAVWTRDGEKLHESKVHTAHAWDLAVSPDGHWAISGSADHTFAIWEATTAKLVHHSPTQATWVTAVAISPDSKTVAIGDYYSNIRIWDIASCKPLLDIRVDQKQHMKAVHSLQFSRDGRYLVSSEQAYQGPTTRVWDAATGKLLGQLDSGTEMVLNIRFSPDGKILALACPDGSVRLFDWEAIAPAPPQESQLAKRVKPSASTCTPKPIVRCRFWTYPTHCRCRRVLCR
jgi:WD40 repeat protein